MGICTIYKKIGDPCVHRNQCGRSSTCFYNDPNKMYGICTEYMKIESLDTTKNVKQYLGNYVLFNEESHLLCKS